MRRRSENEGECGTRAERRPGTKKCDGAKELCPYEKGRGPWQILPIISPWLVRGLLIFAVRVTIELARLTIRNQPIYRIDTYSKVEISDLIQTRGRGSVSHFLLDEIT